MSDWKPIETCNEDGGLVKNMLIVLMDNQGEAHVGWVEDWAGQLVVCDYEGCPIMHALDPWFVLWMPIPKPPKKKPMRK